MATTAQDGRFFQAGAPFGSVNARAATGRWVAATVLDMTDVDRTGENVGP